MGKASSTKKVARAARTGGGRTRRGSSSWAWPVLMTAIVVLGVAGVALSKSQNRAEPPFSTDHWHAAYGIYLCDRFLPNLPEPQTLLGLHTHSDGLIHIEPNVTGSSLDIGRGATLGRWLQGQPDFKLERTSLTVQGVTRRNGDKCGDKPARVEVRENGRLVEGDPKKLRIRDGQLITIAFVPEGTQVDEPPSKANLANPNAMEGGGRQETPEPATAPTSAPSTPAPATTAPGSANPGPPATGRP